jgi:Na+-transporting NADH:ubiquinone oxidoreductase subunit C
MEESREEGMIRKRIFSVVYMFLLTFFFTAMVSGIYEINRERIAINEEIKLQKIIIRVLKIEVDPGISDLRVREVFRKRVDVEERGERIIYRGFSEDRKTLIGYAFPLVGPGFWGPIYGIMAIDPQLERVIGTAFYQHNETPGLGGRITEDWFEEQFKGKKLLPVGKDQRYFSFRPSGTAKAENDVDAITGATGTSKAVERLIDRNLKDYLPWIAEEQAKGRI